MKRIAKSVIVNYITIMEMSPNKTFVTGAQTDIFKGRGGFVEFGHFDKYFVKNSRKKSRTAKKLGFFLLDTLNPI